MNTNKLTGAEGEDLAKRYFLDAGYRFLTRNFSFKHYEIDLIFEDIKKKELVFIEVKTRRSLKYGSGEEAINSCKIKKVKAGAYFYIKLNPEYKNYKIRFDSFTIHYINNEIVTNHIEYSF